MRVFRAFAIGFLMFFGVFLLYFNFCLAVNIQPFPTLFVPNSYNHWNSNYYFGFSSIMEIIDDIPTTFTLASMSSNLEKFEITLGNLSGTFKNFGDFVNTGEVLSLLLGLFNLFTAPIQAIYYFLVINIIMFTQLIEFINLVFKIISGYYNLNIADTWSFGLDELPDGYIISLVDTPSGVSTTYVPSPTPSY